MDYNDNDCEGQNLHLAGEESSKLSVLRPFALPKFDFDDGLHGHLRFDSLVENEVFLGISSQEDNHWIEDFSRGGNGIEFSSSAAESCALPRHINVWSEATSSESVEMLLKAVGQEEMTPGENMIKESDPGDQLGSTTTVVENNTGDAQKVENEIPSLPPAEADGSSFNSNQTPGVGTLLVQETKISPPGVGIDNKDSIVTMTTGNSSSAVRGSDSKQSETCGLVDDSLSHQMQEDLPVPVKEFDNTESSSKNIDISSRESVDQINISSTNLSSTRTMESTFDPVEDQDKGFNENDARFSGISVETDNNEKPCSHETTSSMQSPKEEQAVDTFISTTVKASSMHGLGASVSKDDGNKVPLVLEPTDCSEHSSVSGTEIKQLPESDISLHEHERSSTVLQGEGIEGLGREGNVAIAPAVNDSNEIKEDHVIQSPERHKTLVGSEVSPESNSSLQPPNVTSSPAMLHEAPGDLSEKDHDHKTNDAAGESGKSMGSTVSEESSEKPVTDAMEDAVHAAAPQEDFGNDADRVHHPLVGENICTGKEDIVNVQVDAHEGDVNISTHEKDSEKLPVDPNDMAIDDVEKEGDSTCSAVGVEVVASGSKPDVSVGSSPALNAEVEGAKLPSCVESDQLVDSRESNSPSTDMELNDQSKETEFEAPKERSPSVPKESLDKNELYPATGIEKDAIPASATGEKKTSPQSNPVLETSSVNIPGEASTELSRMVEHTSTVVVAQNEGVDAVQSKGNLDTETERNSGATSPKLAVTGSTVEIDKPNKDAVPNASCTDLSQSEVNKQASFERNGDEHFGKTLETSETSGVNDPCKEDETFSFDTTPLGGRPKEHAGKGLQSFPGLQACKMLPGEGLFPAASVSSQTDPIVAKETSHIGTSTPGVTPPSGTVGPPSERKPRRSGPKSGKGSLKKGTLLKEISPLKQTEKGDRSSPFLSPLGAGQLMMFDSGVKPRGSVSIPTSSLPDLNTSAPSSSFFQQPFTDLQQVQLRAQIFVYGSLIQGAAPDEACMVSAFGVSDGGRTSWERSWRTCVERLHGQKSQGNNIATPLPPRSGAKAPDQSSKQGFPQSEVLSSIAGRSSNKVIPSPVNPAIPLSSPLWNMSTPSGEALPPGSLARSTVIDYQAVSPLNPYQTPPIRNYIAHSTWPAQVPHPPFPVPWIASSQGSPFEVSTSYPAFAVTDPVKLTAVKESSSSISSATTHASPIPTTNTGANAMLAGVSSPESKKVKASSGQTGDTKTRKRKKSSGSENVVQISATASLTDAVSAHTVPNQLSNKAPVSEDFSRISLISQSQVGLVPTPAVGYYSTSVAVTTPSSFLKGPNQALPVMPTPTSSGHLSKGDLNIDKRTFNTEEFSKVEEAKLQAQEAAAHAAAAVSYCESVWSQLDLQKKSGLTPDAESKLASAAAAVAAAASVAKAAAAAAKIASDAAVQARQMADEALTKSGTSNTTDNLNMLPTPILKGGDRSNAPTLVISAAREAARKRIEAASAATRHAENLDAILKAAELASEAVAHAGKVVAMGDPFSLSALAEAGPSNYWKVPQLASQPGSNAKDMNKNKSMSNQHGGADTDIHVTSHNMSLIQTGLSKGTSDHVTVDANTISPIKHGENSSKAHDRKVSNMSSTSLREGSLVEVLKDRGDSKKAWFSAKVLSLKEGEALVCYDVLQSDEGSEQLKDSVSIEAKDGNAPMIRIPHPMTGMQLEGTRKRRRAAVKDYTWSVGDQVDVWVQDCWREGIVAEKNKKDATSLSVHFPVQGDTLSVKVWHLRPSLIWTDGQWIEWCKPGSDGTHQGDTPVEKRPKLGSTGIDAKGKEKMAKNIDFAEVGANEEPKLPLSATEKVFSIGSTREENKPNMVRAMRSGLEKEGSRVVFGGPNKPGKKRKFMDVSKHYVSDKISKTNAPNDSVKLAKLFAPQGSGSRSFRNNSKPDPKEKRVADSKSRAVRSGKPPSIPSRTLARRDDSTSSRSNARDEASSDHVAKGSTSNDENESSEQNIGEVDETSRGPMLFSSQALPQGHRKKAVRNITSERLHQGKLAPAGRKPTKEEEPEKSSSEVGEPRRSNRRIQPTSRLLEGLQSSLLISKIPSSSHDKGHRSHSKGPVRK